MLDGGPRRDPAQHTVRSYVGALRPVLLDWSTRHEHLREITRDEILDHLRAAARRTPSNHAAGTSMVVPMGQENGVAFRDPTAGLSLSAVEQPIPQPS